MDGGGKHVGNIDHCMIPELGESIQMNLEGELGYDEIREMVEELGLAPEKEATLKAEFEEVQDDVTNSVCFMMKDSFFLRGRSIIY